MKLRTIQQLHAESIVLHLGKRSASNMGRVAILAALAEAWFGDAGTSPKEVDDETFKSVALLAAEIQERKLKKRIEQLNAQH
jgi:hypothetical protein